MSHRSESISGFEARGADDGKESSLTARFASLELPLAR
jgi:hypothetical protein